VALHKYDPPDLVSATKLISQSDEDEGIKPTATNLNTTPERITRCVSTAKKNHDHHFSSTSPTMEDSTPISMTEACPSSPFFDPMLATTSCRALDFDELDNENNNEDSDDDLI
jgi:hypothetical protein